MSELHRMRNRFDERNPIQLMALGALSLSNRLHELLELYATEDGASHALPEADPFLDALLGVIAVRDRVVSLLAECSDVEPPPTITSIQIGADSWLR